ASPTPRTCSRTSRASASATSPMPTSSGIPSSRASSRRTTCATSAAAPRKRFAPPRKRRRKKPAMTRLEGLDGADFDVDAVAALLRASKIARIDVRVAGSVVEVQREEATVVVVAVSSLPKAALHPYTEKLSMGHVGVVLVGPPPEEVLSRMPSRAVLATLHRIDAPHALYTAVDGSLERVELRIAAERRSRSIRRYRYELSE